MKEKLVIIGANDFQNPLILKAKELGYETHVFAWQDGSIGEKTADFFYPISIVEKEKILEKCREINPVGICSIGSDLATVTINYVANALGLVSNPIGDTIACTNKFEMRKRLKEHNIKMPKFIKVTKDKSTWKMENFSFPIIVKPTDRSGSRGVTKVNNEKDLDAAIQYAIKDSFDGSAIVEEYIEGNEYSCECISYAGQHHFLSFTKKYTTDAPNFIEIGHDEPSDIDEKYQDKIKKQIFKALDALNIQYGASHTEFRIDSNGDARIIEIGARMGGGCIGSDLVYLSTGYDYVKMVIDIACGRKPDFTIYHDPKKARIRFILTKEDYQEMNDFIAKNNDKIYRVSEMKLENLDKLVDSSTRVGYYIYVE